MILQKLREQIHSKGLNVYVLPRTDEHQSEYLQEGDERLGFISGFTGSNGVALISPSEALVWTDSRYFLQAPKELTEGWHMKKMTKSDPTWFEYIANNYKKEDTVIGIDARLISTETGLIRKKFFEDKGFKIQFMNENLVDHIWEDRPKCHADIFVHEEWAGRTAAEKIKWVQDKIQQLKGSGALFTDLSEICWILNVRSAEIPYNPFMKSVLLMGPEGQGHTLYLPDTHPCLKERSKELDAHFSAIKVQVKPYPFTPLPSNLLYRKKSCNFYIYQSLENPIDWNSIGLYRAARHPKEQEGFRQCHIRDGVAMASFWGWRSKRDSVGEYEAADEMDNRRFKQKHNKGLSFDTISAGGPNAAVVHYHPKKNPDFIITKDMIHLLDSGGQYLDGTTDVTRTFHFGKPTDQQKDAYTRVLLGNLDVQRLIWPKDSDIHGGDIDVLARRRLWQKKLDYGHGTGHGVGHFEGVHEGPCGISKYNTTVFAPGMVVSNEPGYYQQGKFGIRIENLVMCAEDGDYLKFENLTLCPYDRNLIDMKLLTNDEIDFINKYHERCWKTLQPLLEGDDLGKEWLRAYTLPL